MAHTTDTGRLGHAFDRLLHARLPLPLARLYARGSNAVSARNRLLSAYYLHEATLKLAVSIDVMRMLERKWHDAQLDRLLEMLAMPSTGVFAALLPKLAEEDFEGKGPACILCKETKEIPAVGSAIEVLSFGKERRRSLVAPSKLYEHLPAFRNRLITGDEIPEPSECASMAEVLLDAFAQIASNTPILEHLSLGVVDSVSEISNKLSQIKSFDLTGPTPVRTKAEKMPANEAFRSGCPFAKTPEGTWLPLHPLVRFREDEFLPELLFVGGVDPELGILYFDYVTGRVDDAEADLESGGLSSADADMAQLIARARKKPVQAPEYREFSRESAKKYPASGRSKGDKAKTFGEYRLLGELGRGGMGIVYLAKQETVGRFVALKLFPPALAQDAVASARFEREIAALGRCDHPNVVKVIAAGKAERTSYYAMELVTGTTLAGLVDSLPETHSLAEAISVAAAKDRESFEGLPDLPKVSTPTAPESPRPSSRRNALREIADMMAQAAEGVHHLHEHGILHRDLKPANLMVSAEDQRVVVMDLGLAAVEGTSVTQDQDAVLGTLRYMAPEQLIRSATEVDRRSDIYSLGATLYELVTSKPVHDGDSQPRIIQQVLHEDPKRASAVADDVPPDLDAILLRCLSKNPNERYPTAIDLAHDLECFARGEPVTARVPTAREQVWRLVVKYRTYLGLVAAALVALISLAVVSFVKISQERRDVLRLSDLESLETLRVAERSLWPAFPSKVPEMRAWIEEARALTSRIDMHRARLEALQQRPSVTSRTGANGGPAATTAVEDALESERNQVSSGLQAAFEKNDAEALLRLSRERSEIDETLASFESSGGTRTIDFVSDEDQWWHDTLEELVAELAEFEGSTIPSVERRLQGALTLEAMMAERADSWKRAITDIETSDHYGGLEITPQMGLVPIGRDPVTGLEEFAHLESGEVPERDEDGSLRIGEASAIVFVLLPGGSFVMGSESPDLSYPDRIPDVEVRFDSHAQREEAPCHAVSLDPFFLSKYEVSQAQWTRLTGSNPSRYSMESEIPGVLITPLHPLESVSWIVANTVLERRGLRLPTEAQWEYGARGGTDTIWWTGDDEQSLRGACNIADRTARNARIIQGIEFDAWLDDGYVLHSPIGSFAANPFGLHDTIGNVWEWCRDRYGEYRRPTRAGDGERFMFDTENRVTRSGHYLRDATYARSSNRDFQLYTSSHGGLGVRPARLVDGLRDDSDD